MLNLLKNAHYKAEELRGKKLLVTLGAIFLVFTLVGFGSNYYIKQILNENELQETNTNQNEESTQVSLETREGIVKYISPQLYPHDEISYALTDTSGSRKILLKADDQKLEVSEGLYVKVYGKLQKTQDGEEDILNVERLVINQE